MFLYPALLAGFAFVAVPLLVHLINMLRHRRQRWAAMDFLLASFRKQKKWLRMRQLLLLLARLAVAAVLVAMLCGWTGGRQLLGALGGQTTHHIVILDDSYSMGDASGSGASTAYARALGSLQALTQRLASGDGIHQLTVMRASRAALSIRGGSESGDAAADLSAQTITSDAGLISRLMATSASAVRTDLVSALDLASELVAANPADEQFVYIASDFRSRDWGSTERIAESMQKFSTDDIEVRMIDCAMRPESNLSITELYPVQDVWVAGVPVIARATIKNYGDSVAKNVAVACRVIRYGSAVTSIDPSIRLSGTVDALPGIVIESLAPGAEITKTFQVFVSETGTHGIELELPPDSLAIDNTRVCTLPLSDVERVLVIDSSLDEAGAYTIAAVLNPGSQVRIGAVPDIKKPAFLRNATIETLASYRAIYLINLPDVSEAAASALSEYVESGGGLAWFIGDQVRADNYNANLIGQDRQLLPAPLGEISDLSLGSGEEATKTGDILFGDVDTFLDPLRSAGDSSLSMIGLARGWTLGEEVDREEPLRGRYRNVLKRRDGLPLVTQHSVGDGSVVTVLSGLDTTWTNWAGDPTFVPFMLLANARLWSGASARTSRLVEEPMRKTLSTREFFPEVKLASPVDSPPRVTIEMTAESSADGADLADVTLDPIEMLIAGTDGVDDLMKPGLSEWGMLKAEGGSVVMPVATVIAGGEGDLRRADAAEVQQSLLPMEVKFTTSDDWSQQNQVAGSSTLGMLLLALLAMLLVAEQALAYWASYHSTDGSGDVAAGATGAGGVTRPSFGLNARSGSLAATEESTAVGGGS